MKKGEIKTLNNGGWMLMGMEVVINKKTEILNKWCMWEYMKQEENYAVTVEMSSRMGNMQGVYGGNMAGRIS